MGIFDFLKHKCDHTRKELTLEDCIVKMFVSAGMEPYRDGNKFSVVVLGKHYTFIAFIVTISCMEGRELCLSQYQGLPLVQNDLGEDMALVTQVFGRYWKPRYLMDKEARCAYEFMSIDEVLQIVTDEDIDWDSMKGLPQDAFDRAKAHSFHFPGHVYQYKNGVAEVEWQLNPDGMYYRDEDGFGMTDDEEINLYGAIDRKGKVVKKFTLKR